MPRPRTPAPRSPAPPASAPRPTRRAPTTIEYDAVDPESAPAAVEHRFGKGRGPRRYGYTVENVKALSGHKTEAALWKALKRAGVAIDDFEALVRWLRGERGVHACAACVDKSGSDGGEVG